jgi:hypothetical protein
MNFIKVKDNQFTTEECELIIEFFEQSSDKTPGEVGDERGHVVCKDVKDSLDLTLLFSDETQVSRLIANVLFKNLQEYVREYPQINTVSPWSIENDFNIQKYLPGQGYKATHCEHTSRQDDTILAWMVYLNTVEDGGTRFPSYDLTTECKQGTVVVWPAYWTHAHHGVVSNTKTKYIATGWTCFL